MFIYFVSSKYTDKNTSQTYSVQLLKKYFYRPAAYSKTVINIEGRTSGFKDPSPMCFECGGDVTNMWSLLKNGEYLNWRIVLVIDLFQVSKTFNVRAKVRSVSKFFWNHQFELIFHKFFPKTNRFSSLVTKPLAQEKKFEGPFSIFAGFWN